MVIGLSLIAVLAGVAVLDRHLAARGQFPWGAALLSMFLILGAVYEAATVLGHTTLDPLRRVVLVAAAALLAARVLVLASPGTPRALELLVLSAAVVLACVVAFRSRDLPAAANRLAGTFLCLLLVLLWSVLLDVAARRGTAVLFALVLTIKLTDMGGYLVGRMLGRTKLIEHVSPKKTVEGSAGGVLFSVVGGMFLFRWLGPAGWSTAALLGTCLCLSAAAQVGDLFESVLKRAAGVKDSGRLLPEFGGVLDLMDSLVFAVPGGYALLELLGPPSA